jgi:hypothetical protein
MKKYWISFFVAGVLVGCVDNTLDVVPNSDPFPLQLILDSDEGGDLPDAEDVGIEVTFADHLGVLPNVPVILHFTIEDLEDDMVDAVEIDKIIYEVEIDDCVYEREFDFDANGLSGTITLVPDEDLGSIPESFEVVLTLPGLDDTEGSFVFNITEIESSANIELGYPRSFEYEVLDNDAAGEWQFNIGDEETFESFKEVFGPLNDELEALSFDEITGSVTAEFEYGEMKFIVELAEEEEVIECKDGEEETEIVNKVIEIEAEYDAEDGEIEFEGGHFIVGDDGEIEGELDFSIEAEYEIDEISGSIEFSFHKVIDEDHFSEGEELFANESGYKFTFFKD